MSDLDLDFEKEAIKYLDEFQQELDEFETLTMRLAEEDKKQNVLIQIRRCIHSLKGTAGSYGFELLSSACHRVEDQFLSSDYVGVDILIDGLLNLKDSMIQLCNAYRTHDTKTLNHFKNLFGLVNTSISETNDPATTSTTNTISIPKKIRVLIGENSQLLTNTIAHALSEFDVEVSNAKDGYEILGRLIKERFDIFITSIYLPTINTIDLFQILGIMEHTNSHLKTILVTSSKKDATKILREDMIVLEKGTQLEEELRQALKKWAPTKSKDSLTILKDHCKILLIDDSPEIHQLVTIFLKKQSHIQLIHCYNPREAESLIQLEQPQLILLDVQMPELSGDQLFTQLQKKNHFKNCKVIFFTGTDTPSELERLSALGPSDIIRKPFSPKLLIEKIIQIIESS